VLRGAPSKGHLAIISSNTSVASRVNSSYEGSQRSPWQLSQGGLLIFGFKQPDRLKPGKGLKENNIYCFLLRASRSHTLSNYQLREGVLHFRVAGFSASVVLGVFYADPPASFDTGGAHRLLI
jgi:hypothetical protein